MKKLTRHFRLSATTLSLLGLVSLAPAKAHAQPACDAIVYWDANFGGESREITGDVPFVGEHWNDQISSIRVISGNWEFYWDANYGGEVLRYGPGEYAFVGQHWNDQISSMRCVGGGSAGGPPGAYFADGQQYDWYDDGWNGPGFYLLGFAHRHGHGFGGREGWHGMHHGGGGHDGHEGGHGGGGHAGEGHGGGGHAGGGHGGGHGPVLVHGGGGGHHGGGGHGGGGHGGGRVVHAGGGGHGGGGHGGGGHGGGRHH